MGGGGRYPYPKDVWSPAGGWWPHPRMWKRNTAIVTAGIIAICIPIFIWSEKNMVRDVPPHHPIPWRPGVKVQDDED